MMENERLSTPAEIREMLSEMAADGNVEAIQDGYTLFVNGATHTAFACQQNGEYVISCKPDGLPSCSFDTADQLKVAMAEIAAPDDWNVRSDE